MTRRRDVNASKHKADMPAVSEEELNAFVDGELDPARLEEVTALIEQDTALQERIAELKQINDRLKTFGREHDNDDLPPRIRSLVDSWL